MTTSCTVHVQVVKNIVLAGMNVTLQDARSASHDDLSHNFFLGVADVGAKVSAATLLLRSQLIS
jgi:hypothetical protein